MQGTCHILTTEKRRLPTRSPILAAFSRKWVCCLGQAEASFEEMLGTICRLLGERHPKPSNCFRNIAVIIGQQGQLDEALKMQIKALKIRNRTLGEDHVSVGDSLHDIAIVYGSHGDHDEALEMFEEALAVYTRALGINNHENARVHQSIARAKSESGYMVGAMENSREAGCKRRRREGV